MHFTHCTINFPIQTVLERHGRSIVLNGLPLLTPGTTTRLTGTKQTHSRMHFIGINSDELSYDKLEMCKIQSV